MSPMWTTSWSSTSSIVKPLLKVDAGASSDHLGISWASSRVGLLIIAMNIGGGSDFLTTLRVELFEIVSR